MPSGGKKQETNTGAKQKMRDHFHCTMTCFFCGRRKHYEDECYHKKRLSDRLKSEVQGGKSGQNGQKDFVGKGKGGGKSKGGGKAKEKAKEMAKVEDVEPKAMTTRPIQRNLVGIQLLCQGEPPMEIPPTKSI